ncbi:hypothetical protein B0H15DRAFT_815838 [Mycena belliarum]|uniref:DUF7330 domain-containing protein n=1 Tax=Mycena belliarum TaxID=1033014 RepID=A0AAD6Y0N6_9AGAR|nr:hypothetical protein B0H15DRAFT_815838 [Mycena belliae]
MIIDSSTLKNPQHTAAIVNVATLPDDLPPPYITSGLPSGPGAASGSQPLVRPTNYLSLSVGDRPMKGSYVIDPRIQIPSALLSPLKEGEERKNVSLRTSKGPIDVELFVVGGESTKVDMFIASSNGPIRARLHASDLPRPSIHITAQSQNSTIAIDLPRSFRGLVTLHTRSPTISISDPFAAELTLLDETETTRRCFVGDFGGFTDEWVGDALDVESTQGSVTLRYVDEPAAQGAPGAPPVWDPQSMAHALRNMSASDARSLADALRDMKGSKPWGWTHLLQGRQRTRGI